MVSAKRLLVSTCFAMYCYRHPLVSHQTITNIYIPLQNEKSVPCLTAIENKRQLTMLCGGRNRKWHSLQAGTLKNNDE
jgi:hypothetical protein